MAVGTVLGKSPSSINSYLQRLKQVKIANGTLDANGQQVQPAWQDFVPNQLSYSKPPDTGLNTAISNEVGTKDAQLTSAAVTEGQNAKNLALLQQQKVLMRQAKKAYVQKLTGSQVRQAALQAGIPTLQTSGPKAAPVMTATGGTAPAPGRETTINSHGHTVTVNSSVAGRFKGFLDALWSKGYHFQSVSGYSYRTQRGAGAAPGVMSLHSIGYAIDIDPTSNPTVPISRSGHYVYSLPPSVGALAAKYGLVWGGTWHNSKDFMHFSVPYGGRE